MKKHLRLNEDGAPCRDSAGRAIWDEGPAPVQRRPSATWPMVSRSLMTSESELPEIREYERSMGVPTEYVPARVRGMYYPLITGPQHQADLAAIHDLHNADGMRSSDHRRGSRHT